MCGVALVGTSFASHPLFAEHFENAENAILGPDGGYMGDTREWRKAKKGGLVGDRDPLSRVPYSLIDRDDLAFVLIEKQDKPGVFLLDAYDVYMLQWFFEYGRDNRGFDKDPRYQEFFTLVKPRLREELERRIGTFEENDRYWERKANELIAYFRDDLLEQQGAFGRSKMRSIDDLVNRKLKAGYPWRAVYLLLADELWTDYDIDYRTLKL